LRKLSLIIFLSLLLFSIKAPISYATTDTITGPEIVFKQADKILTITQILALYESELGEVSVESDDYTGNGDVPGNYAVTLGVEDETKTISINVRQTIGPVIAVTVTDGDYQVILHKNTVLTANEIIDVLINVQMIVVTSSTQITVLTNTYQDNATAPGTYSFEFYLATISGLEETYLITLKVNDTETLVPDIVLEDDPPDDTEDEGVHWLIKAGSGALIISAAVVLLTYVDNFKKKRKR